MNTNRVDQIADDIGFDLHSLPKRWVHFPVTGREVNFQSEPKSPPTICVWSLDDQHEATLIHNVVLPCGTVKIVEPPYGNWELMATDKISSRWRRRRRD